MSRKSRLSILLLTVALALAGCNRHTVYHQYETVSAEGWDRCDTLWFHIAPAKSDAMLHEELELRTNGYYPFKELCLIVEQTIYPAHSEQQLFASDGIRRVDTLNCRLADEDGRATGKGVNYIQNRFHLTDLSVSQGDSIDIIVHHYMKREVLQGIVDAGVRVVDN